MVRRLQQPDHLLELLEAAPGGGRACDRHPSGGSGLQLSAGAPQANTYDIQSQGIIDLFKKINGDFDEKLADLQKTEMKDTLPQGSARAHEKDGKLLLTDAAAAVQRTAERPLGMAAYVQRQRPIKSLTLNQTPTQKHPL